MILEHLFIPTKKNTQDTNGDRLSRSFLKSVSWRVIGTLDTIIISYFITGELSFALSIGGIELVTKMLLYVVHERLWNNVKWGRK